MSRIVWSIFFSTVFGLSSFAQTDVAEKHINVAMRMIAHKVLLRSGDSTSRVLPIEKEKNRYKLQFDAAFNFEADALVATVDSVVKQSNIAKSYLVEVEECFTGQVIYGYEIGTTVKKDLIPCRDREQPKGCYAIYITILEASVLPEETTEIVVQPEEKKTAEVKPWLGFSLFMVLMGVFALLFWRIYKRKKSAKTGIDTDAILIGEILFDKKNSRIFYKKTTVELTAKEADLLFLLYQSANQTVERDFILNTIWGDEGVYIGRTLDVFISKLRKKLEADESIKIVNIRGIGYKLVIP